MPLLVQYCMFITLYAATDPIYIDRVTGTEFLRSIHMPVVLCHAMRQALTVMSASCQALNFTNQKNCQVQTQTTQINFLLFPGDCT